MSDTPTPVAEIRRHIEATHQKHSEELTALRSRAERAEGELKATTEKLSEQRGQLDEIRRRVEATERAQVRSGRKLPHGEEGKRSYGDAVVTSEAWKALVDKGLRNSDPIHVQTRGLAQTSSDLVEQTPIRGEVPILTRAPKLLDILPATPTDGDDVIRYIEETQNSLLYTQLNAAVIATATSAVLKNGNGFFAGQTITFDEGGAAQESKTILTITRSGNPDDPKATITFSALANPHAALSQVTAAEFSPTAEAEFLPSGKFIEVERTVPVKAVKTSFTVAKDYRKKASRAARIINQKIPRNLDLSTENQILNGSNTDGQIKGLLTHASVPTRNWSDGDVGDTQVDALAYGAHLIRLAELTPTAVLMHPTDAYIIGKLKDDQGRYLELMVRGADGMPRLINLPVVETSALDAGTALVGDFVNGCTLYYDGTDEVRVYEETKADQGCDLIVGSRPIALTIERPQAFCKVVFDNAPT